MFRKIYETGTIPQQWKIGKITPIPKKGNKNASENYRPITSLCSLAKVFERCILERIMECGDVTGLSQHGFKRDHSTVTALLEIQNRISRNINRGKYHEMISLDLSAAFDMVNHEILVERMKTAGLPNDIINILKNWLTGRKAYVECGWEVSDLFPVTDGTVQGSVLGPILFAIFVRPMSEMFECTSFADDSYIDDGDYNLELLVQRLQSNATRLAMWFKNSGLVVNESKTEICIFHKTKKISANFVIGEAIVTSKNTLKVLGIIMDSNLNWEHQVSKISQECTKINAGFHILKKYFIKEELLILATSIYYSKLYYAASVWLMPSLSPSTKNQAVVNICFDIKKHYGSSMQST